MIHLSSPKKFWMALLGVVGRLDFAEDPRFAERKKRIAKGSGMQVQDVNKLLKQHADMLKMMKRVNKLGEKGFMRGLGGMMQPPGFPR